MVVLPLPWTAHSMLNDPFSEEILLIANLNLSQCVLRQFPLVKAVISYLGKETDPHLAAPSFQAVVEWKVLP